MAGRTGGVEWWGCRKGGGVEGECAEGGVGAVP